MADPADVNVDDLRRRARRRLVGAIVLALAAAVFVPMLLESDPKPLGEDVSVRIPPVDDGKFVNRLNDASKAPSPKSTATPKNDPRSDVKPEAKTGLPE
jgi:DedD protein